MEEYIVKPKQNVYDVCLQVYGTTQLLLKLTVDNGIEPDTDLEQGTVLIYDSTLGNNLTKDILTRNSIIVLNTGE